MVESDPHFSRANYTPAMFGDTHTDYVYVSGLRLSDPKEYVLAFDDQWNHDGDGVHVLCIDREVGWENDIRALHKQLAKQKKELAAQGREMKLVRPAWSAWPDPYVTGHPLAGPRPWYRRRNGRAVFVGVSVGFVTALVMAVVMFRRRRRRGETEPDASGETTLNYEKE